MNNPDLDLWSTFWKKSLEKIWDSYYSWFYSSKEKEAFRYAESASVRAEETIARMEPWLHKRGWKVLGYDSQALTECVVSVAKMKSRGGK